MPVQDTYKHGKPVCVIILLPATGSANWAEVRVQLENKEFHVRRFQEANSGKKRF